MISLLLNSLIWILMKGIIEPSCSILRLGRRRKDHACLLTKSKEPTATTTIKPNLEESVCSLQGLDETENSFSEDSLFRGELSRSFRDCHQTTLTLDDFVDKGDAQDTLALREMLECDGCRWRNINLMEIVPANTYRRWLFKKSRVHRRILGVATDQEISVHLNAKVVISTNSDSSLMMSHTAIVSLLRDIQKDTDVKSIEFSSDQLNFRDYESIAMALVSLISCDSRPWESVVVRANISHEHDCERKESQLTQKVCGRALTKVADELGVPLDIQLC